MSILNTLLVFLFAVRMKKKIDFVAKTTKSDTDDADAKEFYLAHHTIIF